MVNKHKCVLYYEDNYAQNVNLYSLINTQKFSFTGMLQLNGLPMYCGIKKLTYVKAGTKSSGAIRVNKKTFEDRLFNMQASGSGKRSQ